MMTSRALAETSVSHLRSDSLGQIEHLVSTHPFLANVRIMNKYFSSKHFSGKP